MTNSKHLNTSAINPYGVKIKYSYSCNANWFVFGWAVYRSLHRNTMFCLSGDLVILKIYLLFVGVLVFWLPKVELI